MTVAELIERLRAMLQDVIVRTFDRYDDEGKFHVPERAEFHGMRVSRWHEETKQYTERYVEIVYLLLGPDTEYGEPTP